MRLNIFSIFGKNTGTPRERGLAFYEAMKPFHEHNCRQWYYNLAMLRGRQWASYDSNRASELTEPAAPSWRVRARFNKLLPLFNIKRHKIIPLDPIISCRSANGESQTDKDNAELARKILVATWRGKKFKKILNKTVARQGCSVGYIETLWDGQAGRKIGPAPAPAPEGTMLYEGDVEFEAASPFNIIVDYSEENPDDIRRYLKVRPRSIDYIKSRWGIEVKEETLDPTCLFYLKAMALASGNTTDYSKVFDKHAMVFDYKELPSKDYPNGLHHIFTKTEDILKPEGESMDPYFRMNGTDKEYFLPMEMVQDMELPDMLIGTNSVEQALEAQCLYNQGKSVVQENCKQFGRIKILAPEGAIPRGAWIDDPAEKFVEYSPDVPVGSIIPLKPPEMAQYHLDAIRSMPAEMEDAFGVHQASQGILPRRATSGKAISFLIGQDDERTIDPRQSLDDAIESSFRKALFLMVNGYTEERIKDITGDDGKAIRIKMKGENFREVDVTITRDTALPRSAADRMDLATTVLEKNPTKEQVELMFAIMSASTMEDLKAILSGNSQAEETYVRMENYDMRKGIPRPASIGENHQLHIRIHQELLRDPNTSPEAKIIVMDHVRQHDVVAGQESAQMAQAMGEADIPAPEEGQPEGALQAAGQPPQQQIPGGVPPGV